MSAQKTKIDSKKKKAEKSPPTGDHRGKKNLIMHAFWLKEQCTEVPYICIFMYIRFFKACTTLHSIVCNVHRSVFFSFLEIKFLLGNMKKQA